MARKKIDLNSSPLETVTIGDVKQNKYGWIGVLLLFGFFIAVIYYLPEIEAYYEKNFKNNSSSTQIISNNNIVENNTEVEESNEKTYQKYEFNYETTIELQNLKYTNFSYQNNILNFTVVNSTEASIEPKNIYIELYDENDSLVKRILLSKIVGGLDSQNYEYNDILNASYFYLKEILESDYTYIDVDVTNDNKSTLTCNNTNETLVYTFSDDKLSVVEDKITYAKTNIDYDSVYEKYKTEVLKYTTTSGVTANIGLDSTGLVYSMEVDYSLLEISLNNLYYFSKGDSIRKVNFEMEAMFFDCK